MECKPPNLIPGRVLTIIHSSRPGRNALAWHNMGVTTAARKDQTLYTDFADTCTCTYKPCRRKCRCHADKAEKAVISPERRADRKGKQQTIFELLSRCAP